MKKIFVAVLVLALALLFSSAFSRHQNSGKQKVKSSNPKFTGTWRGAEKCNSAGAPVAILLIATTGPAELTLSGIYSIQGKVKATVKSKTITIPLQEVKDPNFMNLWVEGELVLSANGASISGKIKVVNNQAKDECAVQYNK